MNDPAAPYDLAGLFGITGWVPVAHPEPRVILRLWQVFVDNVNPLMRIVHVPTTHQMIVEASWDANHAPPATSALLFAVYSLAVISMSPKDYSEMFSAPNGDGRVPPKPPSKFEVLRQYRTGGAQALLAAGLLTTRHTDVLRAFTLYLLGELDVELSSTMTAVATHIGMKLGLHRETSISYDNKEKTDGRNGKSYGQITFFEREMRLRLWWQIVRQGASVGNFGSVGSPNGGAICGSGGSGCNWLTAPDPRHMRLPLNINDVDLHPDMAGPPLEHTGPTEIVYLLMKYEAARWMRQFAERTFASQRAGKHNIHSPYELALAKDSAIDELEELFEHKYLRYCDPNIPLHTLTVCMGRLAVAQLRFQSWHPRVVVSAGESTERTPALFPQQSADAVFHNAVRVLDLYFTSRQVKRIKNSFAVFQMMADAVMRILVDAVVYVVSVLRVRTGWDDVTDGGGPEGGEGNKYALERPLRVVELFYAEYGDDLAKAAVDDKEQGQCEEVALTEESRRWISGTAFAVAFCDLTLEAWEARMVARRQDGETSTPEFIIALQQQQQERRQRKEQHKEVHTWTADPLQLSDDMSWKPVASWKCDGLDWELWNDFLQM
ncbi:fungal specific transcription factor domain containing protein [Grosmannia clavigera kw1407]|uniref:Fungal specific transcription factor domain containing protein n=1 Tax=Grosmannia clavigera (strain kw1407 / UAMH 11150) TaxID=655863 RepID=F0XJK5_GROCL|nr:fungal specific transcription factor domain containing protein [Grosmannia clavigera kw1407]EFX02164.1 fungal specific transcription factor domain containing protein [Grosmannia clavigera kw1407]